MAANALATESLLKSRDATRPKPFSTEAFARHGARGLWAAAAVLLLGTAVDLFVLWGLQFQASMQWEFVAIVNTLEAYTRLVLGVGLAYGALVFSRSSSLWAYRSAGALMLLLGLAAATLSLLLITDYYPLSRFADGQGVAQGALTVTAVKGLLLGGVYSLVLIPLGILNLRKPRIA